MKMNESKGALISSQIKISSNQSRDMTKSLILVVELTSSYQCSLFEMAIFKLNAYRVFRK